MSMKDILIIIDSGKQEFIKVSFPEGLTARKIASIKNLIKYRKFGSPLMSMAKIISMAAALVSMLSLETAMLSEFGKDMSPDGKWLMIALTGACVSVIVIAMSVYSIVKNTREIRRIK